MTRLDIRARQYDGAMKYMYELRTSDSAAAGPLEQEYTLDVAQDVVIGLRERIDAVLARSLDGTIDHRAELTEYGQALYRQLFRGDASNLVNRIKESTGPFVVRTNESVVPWELLHDGSEFLGLAYDLGRHSIVDRRVTTGRQVDRIRRALIVGDPIDDLDAARHEAEHIAAWLRERGAECTVLLGEQAKLTDVVMRLGTPYDLLHFCGHVATKYGSDYSGLLLHGRQLLDEQGLMTIEQVGAPPIVFVNGCDSAGQVANICLSFMVLGAKTVVGTSAEVPEDGALRFAEQFYQSLLGGATAGAAMRTARTSLTGESHAAWASFTLYGDPGEYIPAGEKPAPRAAPPPANDAEGEFDERARELIARAEELAAAHELVTSLDLLAALVTTPELRAGMESRIGAPQVAEMIQLIYLIIEGVATRKAEGSAPPWSDSVKNVLAAAVRQATADGRAAATPQDIADAFVASGGGSSARLVQKFVDLDELLSTSPAATVGTGERPQAHTESSEADGELFRRDGRIRAGLLDDAAGAALRTALLLAAAREESSVSSYRLLRGFGLTGSDVLRRHLAAQGDAGERAFRVLASGAEPRRSDLSRRVTAALDDAAGRGVPADEATVLYALLSQERSSAREGLRALGVDTDQLLRALRTDLGDTAP